MGAVQSAFPPLPLSGGDITGNLSVDGSITGFSGFGLSGNALIEGNLEANGNTSLEATIVASLTSNGSIELALGQKLIITGGANARMGTATLVAGTVTIATTAITANSVVFLTDQSSSLTNIGILSVTAKTAGTSFVVTSANALDTSTFGWLILDTA